MASHVHNGAGPWEWPVWLTLAIGAIGFGGMFCVYTYLASTMAEVTHAAAAALPVVLAVFGAGMTVGTCLLYTSPSPRD